MKIAEELCSTLNGVREVINNIVVNTPHDDNAELIADRVFEALDSDPMVKSAGIYINKLRTGYP